MRRVLPVVLQILLALATTPAPAYAGGIVSVCDEAHLLAAVVGGGTVTFACSGTITLTTTITITSDTTVDGNGQTVVVDGGGARPVFTVDSGVTLSLNWLTIAHGRAQLGGGIHNDGTLIVTNSTFSGNRAEYGGGIYNTGTLIVTNTVFVDNSVAIDTPKVAASGGGIINHGTASVTNSTFSGNTASHGDGGGITNAGTLTVTNTTFSGNTAFTGFGGGIDNFYYGALTVSNCTFVGNQASVGGAVGNRGTTTVTNSTFSDNSATSEGSGIYAGGAAIVTLKNTIVASSRGNCFGSGIIDGGGNLSYPDATCPGINADPKLGPLQDNGGPTRTLALGASSAARDAGNDAICAAAPVNNLDQRGFSRPVGPHCDIGAYEASGIEPIYGYLPLIVRQHTSGRSQPLGHGIGGIWP